MTGSIDEQAHALLDDLEPPCQAPTGNGECGKPGTWLAWLLLEDLPTGKYVSCNEHHHAATAHFKHYAYAGMRYESEALT